MEGKAPQTVRVKVTGQGYEEKWSDLPPGFPKPNSEPLLYLVNLKPAGPCTDPEECVAAGFQALQRWVATKQANPKPFVWENGTKELQLGYEFSYSNARIRNGQQPVSIHLNRVDPSRDSTSAEANNLAGVLHLQSTRETSCTDIAGLDTHSIFWFQRHCSIEVDMDYGDTCPTEADLRAIVEEVSVTLGECPARKEP